MTRSRDEVNKAIIDMTDAERGHVIERIRAHQGMSEPHKDAAIKFVMLLGLINKRFPPAQ